MTKEVVLHMVRVPSTYDVSLMMLKPCQDDHMAGDDMLPHGMAEFFCMFPFTRLAVLSFSLFGVEEKVSR